MSNIIRSIPWPPSRKLVFTTVGVVGGLTAIGLIRRYYIYYFLFINYIYRWYTSSHSRRISKLPDEIEGNSAYIFENNSSIVAFDSLETTILYLEKLLSELEKVKLGNESQRNRYELIHSILIRLNGAKSDFEKFRRNDFGARDVATEDIGEFFKIVFNF